MARTPMVTRTLKATYANCMCVNVELGEVQNIEVTVSRTYKNDKALVKAIEKANLIPENLKLVKIVDTEVLTKKYGMTETEFMATAKELI